tara:strand:- start:1325 stop:1561 length:237 start_codon:yes stop_codon:yes gene_type:complete
MNNKYEVRDILEAIDSLLSNNEKILKLEDEVEKPLVLKNNNEKPLKLTREIKSSRIKLQDIPKNTEKIILQAEKHLKR